MPVPSASLILTAFLPVAATLGAGYVLRRRGVVDEGVRAGLMNLVLKLFFPALVLAKVSRNPAMQDNAVALAAPLAGFLSLLVGYTVCRALAGACGADTPERRRAFAYTAGNYNYGYLALPVCEVLHGRDSLAVLLLFNAGLELCFWTTGMVLLTGGVAQGIRQRLINPVSVSMVAAFAINRTGLGEHLPESFYKTGEMLGGCAVPCGLLLVGMGVPALIDGFRAAHDARLAIGSVILRNGLVPALFVGAAMIPGVPGDVGDVLRLQAAMPAAMFPIVMCQHHRVAPQVALRIVVATSIAAVVTLPAWLWVGSRL